MAVRQETISDWPRSVPGNSVPDGLHREGISRPHRMIKQHTLNFAGETVEDDDDSDCMGDMRFECSVCLSEYHESGNGVPRSLLCGHTFCTGCLIELVKEFAITCPKCHHVTPISSHGVAMTLVKNFGVLEIIYSHPSSYRSKLSKSTSSANSSLSKSNPYNNSDHPITFNADIPICQTHGDRLTSFCVKDKVLVCSSCLLYGEHKDHPCQLVNDASIEFKLALRKLIPEVRKKNSEMKKTIVEIKQTVEEVQKTSASLNNQVDIYFGNLIAILEERRKEMNLEILHRTQSRVEALLEQSRSLEEAVRLADDCFSTISDSLDASNHDFLQNYTSVREKILLLFANALPMKPLARNDLYVKFPPESILEDFEGQFKHHGSIQSEISVVEEILYDSFHDGFRVYWQNQDYVDSEGCTYSLQVANPPDKEYTLIYRGGDTKFTYRRDDLKSDAVYKFRVRVQTTEGCGAWSPPMECQRAPPSWLWDRKRRHFKIDLSSDCLEVSSRHSSEKHWGSVSGNKVFHHGVFYVEIEILELAKHQFRKNWFTKIALGVVQSSDTSANDILWENGKYPVGKLSTNSHQDHNSWGYIVTSGVKVSTTTGRREENYGDVSSLVVGDRIGMLVEVNEQEPSTVSFFCNGNDLGVAYNNLSPPLLPVLSVCDKFSVRLRFPPPPYTRRNHAQVTLLTSKNESC